MIEPTKLPLAFLQKRIRSSMSSPEKEKSKKRAAEKKRQLDLMKVAVGSEECDEEEDDDEGLTRRGGGKKSNPSTMAMESARRFLWDEDEDEETDVPLGGPSPNITLTGTQTLFSSKEYGMEHQVAVMDAKDPKETPRSGFMGIFRGRGGRSSSTSDNRRTENIAPRKPPGSVRKSENASLVTKIGKCLLFLLIIAAFVVGLFGLVSLITQEKDELQAAGGDKRLDSFYKQIQAHSPIDLNDKESSQYKALKWLTDQDPLQLAPHSDDVLQRYILAVVFFSFSGHLGGDMVEANWTHQDGWMGEGGICSWFGVECVAEQAGKEGMVLGLNLTDNNIVGTLPAELKSLRLLGRLDLSLNEIEGSIPEELLNTQNLIDLILRGNKLSGSILGDFGKLSILRELDLGENQLTGKIPIGLAQATRLKALSLERNKLEGSIPALGSLESLGKFSFCCFDISLPY